jgi:hypothetical protein
LWKVDQNLVERAGGITAMMGGAALAAIFLVVMVNGKWPQAFAPVKQAFASIAGWIGGAAIVAEVWIFIGPGVLLMWLGRRMRDRSSRR